jgi:predicted secreted Zn-dependent protease
MVPGVFLALALALQVQPIVEPPPPSSRLFESAAPVGALPQTRLTGYVVSGRNLRSVRAMMTDARPADSTGARHDALTSWRIQPKLMQRNGECDPQSADVEYTITVTLPDLETRDQLNRSERAEWDRYFAALIGHETNHVRIVQVGVERLKASMQAARGCEAIHAASRAVLAEIREASAQYDRQTRHGATEGALLMIRAR